MAIRLLPGGVWEFDSAREAMEFGALQSGARPRPAAPAATVQLTLESGTAVPAKPKRQRIRHRPEAAKTIDAIRFIMSAGTAGAHTSKLAEHLGLSDPRGLSGVLQGVKRRIAEVSNGTPIDRILWASGGVGNKTWHLDAKKAKELGIE